MLGLPRRGDKATAIGETNGSTGSVLGIYWPVHPFGLADNTLSFVGHTLLCNALGFEQRQYVDGEPVGTWGEIR